MIVYRAIKFIIQLQINFPRLNIYPLCNISFSNYKNFSWKKFFSIVTYNNLYPKTWMQSLLLSNNPFHELQELFESKTWNSIKNSS